MLINADGELFPFDLKRHEIDAPIDSDYLEMAESVKLRTGCLTQDDTTTHMEAAERVCPVINFTQAFHHIGRQSVLAVTSDVHLRSTASVGAPPSLNSHLGRD